MPQTTNPSDTTNQTPPAPDEIERTKAPAAPASTGRRSRARPAPTHYKVTSGGLTGAGGAAHYRDAVLTPDQVGDEARIAHLLSKGAIAPVEIDDDAADA